jgi:Mrp family chromosome partitioning ATPase
VDITFTSRDAATAAAAANAVAEAYVDEQRARKADAALQAASAQREPLAAARDALKQAEEAIAAHRAANANRAQQRNLVRLQLEALDEQMNNARLALSEAKSHYASAQENEPDQATDKSVAVLRTRYAALARSEARMSDDYGERHPFLMRTRTHLANLQREIGERVSRSAERQRQNVEAAATQLALLEEEHGRLQDEAFRLDQSDARLRALESEERVRRARVDELLSQNKAAMERQGSVIAEPVIVTSAPTPGLPVSPPSTMWLVVVGALGASLGLASAFAFEKSDRSFRTCEEIERGLPLRCLGVVPSRFSTWEQSVAAIFSRLRDSNGERPNEVFLIASATRGEGASALATSLAREAVRSDLRTLLVAGDFARPSLSQVHGRAMARLVGALQEKIEVEKSVAKDKDAGFYRLRPAGRSAFFNAAAEPDERRLAALVERFRRTFAVVIVDGPPILAGSRCGRIMDVCDKAVLAVAWRRTRGDIVAAALRSLGASINNVAGVFLTQADLAEYRLYAPKEKEAKQPAAASAAA